MAMNLHLMRAPGGHSPLYLKDNLLYTPGGDKYPVIGEIPDFLSSETEVDRYTKANITHYEQVHPTQYERMLFQYLDRYSYRRIRALSSVTDRRAFRQTVSIWTWGADSATSR